MSKRVKNALIIILLLVVALGGGALTLFDVFGYRTWTTERLTSDFHTMAQQKFGDEGEAIVLIDYNEDAIALLCCNATRDRVILNFIKEISSPGNGRNPWAPGTLERKLVCTVMRRPTSVRTIPKEPPIFLWMAKAMSPRFGCINSNDWEEGKL